MYHITLKSCQRCRSVYDKYKNIDRNIVNIVVMEKEECIMKWLSIYLGMKVAKDIFKKKKKHFKLFVNI